MNVRAIMAVGVMCGGLVFLGGCASMKDKDSRSLGDTLSNDRVDATYVAEVNANAKKYDVQVYWINPPVAKHN